MKIRDELLRTPSEKIRVIRAFKFHHFTIFTYRFTFGSG